MSPRRKSLTSWLSILSILGGYDGLERTGFGQFSLWEGFIILKGLIFYNFHFGRVWWFERNYFGQVLLWDNMVLLKGLNFVAFYFGRMWWFVNSTILTVGGYGGLEMTDFKQFPFWEGVVVFKYCFSNVSTLWGYGVFERTDCWHLLSEGVVFLTGLILDNFYCGRIWWSWKDWFWTVSTFRECGGLERAGFQHFLPLKGVAVLKGVIFNNFHFGWM